MEIAPVERDALGRAGDLDDLFDDRGRQVAIAPPEVVAQEVRQDDRMERPLDIAAVLVAVAKRFEPIDGRLFKL